jgi:hypothetical protein
MKHTDLSHIVTVLKGLMPESSRTELAYRLAQLVEREIIASGNEIGITHWRKFEMAFFLQRCGLTTTVRPVVPYDIAVEESKLAEFCNRWMNVSAFKLIDEPADAMRPITTELNGLRVSMIAELRALAGLETNQLPEEVKPINYADAIADAAAEYRSATSEHDLERTEETQREKALAYDKLTWMLDAEGNGWNPDDYQPED